MRKNSKAVCEQRTAFLIYLWFFLTSATLLALAQTEITYKIVDTGQRTCYNNSAVITAPSSGQSFYGQDAQYSGNQPAYRDNGDGTVSDLVTGLMWQKSPDRDGNDIIDYKDKMYFDDAKDSASSFRLAGYSDWRLPTIKELYSLVMYSGAEPNPNGSSPGSAVPFIDTSYFRFAYGDLNASERIIDAQYASATLYVSTTMNGNRTMFGFNFADGRIKGYPADRSKGKKYYVLYVRGATEYGKNSFVDNNDGTITDRATGLVWMKNDNGVGVAWENALSYAEGFEYAGYSDWRLPNAKELQSILDYTRSPATTNSAAIDPMFLCAQITNEAGAADYPCYWSSTTFSSLSPATGREAVYLCFGRAMGYMNGNWIDVHGAGAQRSDPKTGNPADYPQGHGPQGDAIRIYNYVRLVRDGSVATDVPRSGSSNAPVDFILHQNFPNPFSCSTTISYELPREAFVTVRVYDVLGNECTTLLRGTQAAGRHEVRFLRAQLQRGVYFVRLIAGRFSATRKVTIIE